MGLLKHRNQKKAGTFSFSLQVHVLSWPSDVGSLCVSFQRGSHSGATRRAAPSPRRAASGATYVFEEALSLPVTLYQDAAAARKGSTGRGLGPFLSKDLRLAVVRADPSSGKPTGAPLGSITLNLADYAAEDGRTQQTFAIAPAGGKLLLTISCRDSSHSKGGAPPSVETSLSSLEMEMEGEGLPASMSTDDEGSASRASSPGAYSRPTSAAAAHSGPSLATVPEDAAVSLSRQSSPTGAANSALRQEPLAAAAPAAAAAAAAQEALPQQQPERYDEDGFLLEESVGGVPEASQEAASSDASVRRNLCSAMEQAEPSAAGSRAGEATGPAVSEVQSRDSSNLAEPAAAGAAGAATAFARLRSGAAAVVPATPAGAVRADSHTPEPASTGQQSSILSAAGDPTVPFSAPPSTSRRFAAREGAGAATSRRWAWRRDGAAGGTAAAAAAGASTFQRARLASASQPESPSGDAAGAAPVGAAEGPADVAGSSGRSGSPAELSSSRRTTSEEAAVAPHGGAAMPAPSVGAAVMDAAGGRPISSSGPGPAGLAQFQPTPPTFGGSGNGVDAAAAAAAAAAGGAAQRQQRAVPALGSGLLPAISLMGGDSVVLPSPVDYARGAATTPHAPNSLVVDALLQELRNLAALESAVYLAGGRHTFSGSSSQLHAPARRLARTIISLGPHERLAFGFQAIRAIEATAGAASGDMHRLTFWWSNVLQLRWCFWTLCQNQALGQASSPVSDGDGDGGGGGMWPSGAGLAAGRSSRLGYAERQGSDQPSPQAAAAAAAGRSSSLHGQDWIQVLLPQLRELEAWLFAEMLKHLWWRVLLQSVMAQQPSAANGTSGASTPAAAAAAAAAAAGFANSHNIRSAKSAPHLVHAGSGIDRQSPAARQGTPRSFESPEEEAVHQWVQGLRAVERALKDPARPAPAPRQHLALLHRQLIIALLRRLDTLLFRRLLAEDGNDSPRHPLRLPSMSGRTAFDRSADAVEDVLGLGGAEAAAVGLLGPSLLPFQRGPLTFSTGVHLKMAVSRLTSWAADCGVKEDRMLQAARSTEMSDYRLFPCLRATADLLMMPKEVLTDREMRREVVPGLPLHRICQLLERFEPDDCAPDPLPPGLLEALQSESPHSDSASTPSPTCKAEEEYLPPAEAALLADGIIEPLSLDMGEESEDELESLTGSHSNGMMDSSPSASSVALLAAAAAGDELRASRFALLRGLWVTAG